MNDTQKAALANELKNPQYAKLVAGQRYPELAAMLNAKPMIDNPTPQPTRSKLITWSAFMTALSDTDGVKLYDHGALASDMKAALAANDRAMAQDLWRSIRTFLSPASITAVQAAFQQTELDPTYQAMIPGQSVADTLGLGTVRASDVQSIDV